MSVSESGESLSTTIDSLRSRLAAIGQDHLLAFWGELDGDERTSLISHIESLDLDSIPELVATYVRRQSPVSDPDTIEPAPFYPRDPGSDVRPWDAQAARSAGETLIRAGKVACFTVAGGQGSRLGYDGPKGCYPAGAVSRKPLFQIFGEGILANQRKYETTIPWYIMTSPLNDAQTRAFFDSNNHFGLDPSQVVLIPQGVMPSFDAASGRILLASRCTIATNPDGHGGSYRALVESGATADMRSRGVEHVSYFQVDNPLGLIIDPVFLGLHVAAPDSSGEMSSKMVPKRDPSEPVGVFCVVDGTLDMIEYSDLPKKLAEERNEDGSLRFGAGNPAIHAMSVEFIERIHADPKFALPFHRAVKRVAFVDPGSGRSVEPQEPNAIKLERFVFDAMGRAKGSIILETDRVEEFGPIKNADGDDSPQTSSALQTERAARWLETTGIQVPRRADGTPDCVLEISASTAIEASDLADADLPITIERGASLAI